MDKKIKKTFIPRCLMAGILFVLTIATANPQTAARTSEAETSVRQEQQVRDFVAAFNTQNTERMLEMVAENIQWISVNEMTAPVEAEGITNLQKSMNVYFKRCPSCRSTLEWVQSSKNRVTTLERAEWMGKSGLKAQKGLAVYEFRADKISRVYYFPAEVFTNQDDPISDWQKINAKGLFSFKLPKGFAKTDLTGVENYLGEYRMGETRFLFIHNATDSNAYDARHEPKMENYEEVETKIDGKQANIRTFSQIENGNRIYRAEMNIGDWKSANVELYMKLESKNRADLEAAKQIFRTVDFP